MFEHYKCRVSVKARITQIRRYTDSKMRGDCVLANSSPIFVAKNLHPSFCRIFYLPHLSAKNTELPCVWPVHVFFAPIARGGPVDLDLRSTLNQCHDLKLVNPPQQQQQLLLLLQQQHQHQLSPFYDLSASPQVKIDGNAKNPA